MSRWALLRVEAAKPMFLLNVAMIPVAMLALLVLRQYGLVARTPAWLVPLIVVVGGTTAALGNLWWTVSQTQRMLLMKVALQVAVVTAGIYATGWGPALGIGMVLVAQESLTSIGPRVAPFVAMWSVLGFLAGEILLELGVFPSLLPFPHVHGLAVLMALGTLFTVRVLAGALREKGDAIHLVEMRERRFRTLVQSSHDLVFVTAADGEVTYASPSSTAILGHSPEVFMEGGVKLIPTDARQELGERFAIVYGSPGSSIDVLFPITAVDGSVRWLEGIATNLVDDPAIQGVVCNLRDVTERLARERRQAAMVSLGRAAMAVGSEEFAQETARVVGDVLGARACRVHDLTVGSAHVEATSFDWFDDCTMRVVVGDGTDQLGVIVVTADHPLADDETQFVEAVGSLLQSSILRARSERLTRHQATHDSLTGLPNRALLHTRLAAAIDPDGDDPSNLSLLLIDLDGFKEINDTLGHPVGDSVLVELGERLHSAIGGRDTVARLGGDEFAVVLDQAAEADPMEFASQLWNVISEPIAVGRTLLSVGASIGVARFPEHGRSATDLMKHADIAMYEAKRLGTRFALFEEGPSERSEMRLRLMGEFGPALDLGEFTAHYQPKVDLRTGLTVGVEALARWNHPELGMVPPDLFVPVAEQTGQIDALTALMLRTSLEHIPSCGEAGRDLALAVNLSPRTLHDQNLVRLISTELERSGFDPSRLVLEVTENALMANPLGAARVLRQLVDLGTRVSVDDFGTGYASLSYLRDLPIGEIKLDRSYVAEMATRSRSAALVHSIVDLGHRLGLDVIAEGIEDHETLGLLLEAGVTLGQGYLFSRPVPIDELRVWLGRHGTVSAAASA